MTITREQVADLQPGDVVEYAGHRDLRGASVRGPLYIGATGSLCVGDDWVIRSSSERNTWVHGQEALTLTVVSHAPRPLYVNHPRTGAMFGDVVRLENDGGQVVMFTRVHGWVDNQGEEWDPKRKNGLRLLVDGETGQVVP